LTTLRKFLFADLDDTLFQTLEKCGAHGQPGALEPAAFLKDGAACSFTTPAQRALLDFLRQGMTVIPTTARNIDAYRRVKLDFSSYAVLDYGGVVLLPDGSVDRPWLERIRTAMQGALPGLQELAQLVDEYARRTGFEGRARLVEDCATPFYLLLKDPGKVAARLEPVERDVVAPWVAARSAEYYLHRNGNNLAVLPQALNKAHAVAHVTASLRELHGGILTFGMGDSRVDARFMAACDYAIVPARTQLAGATLEAL
jgi:predicted mannosyl-3-phosphoglycerate phosphatase (HAD superfamily)